MLTIQTSKFGGFASSAMNGKLAFQNDIKGKIVLTVKTKKSALKTLLLQLIPSYLVSGIKKKMLQLFPNKYQAVPI